MAVMRYNDQNAVNCGFVEMVSELAVYHAAIVLGLNSIASTVRSRYTDLNRH